MSTNSLQQRQKLWVTLPENLRELLSAEETVELIEKVGTKHGLSEMDQGFLIRITGKLLEGFLPPSRFVKEVVENIDVSQEEARYIAQDLNRDIFNAVKDSLEEVHHLKSQKVVESLGEYARTHGAPSEPTPPAPIPSPLIRATTPVSAMRIMPGSAPVQSDKKQIDISKTPILVPPPTSETAEPKAAATPSPKTPGTKAADLTAEKKAIRGEWGWHGRKNEQTGKIEFKHESVQPEVSAKIFPIKEEGVAEEAGQIGSILEQKLGGTFRIKGDIAEYGGQVPAPAPTKPVTPVVTPPITPAPAPTSTPATSPVKIGVPNWTNLPAQNKSGLVNGPMPTNGPTTNAVVQKNLKLQVPKKPKRISGSSSAV